MCAAGGFYFISCRAAVELSEFFFSFLKNLNAEPCVCVSEEQDFVHYVCYFSQQFMLKAKH